MEFVYYTKLKDFHVIFNGVPLTFIIHVQICRGSFSFEYYKIDNFFDDLALFNSSCSNYFLIGKPPYETQRAQCTVTAGEVQASAEASVSKTLEGVCGSGE